jgi:hypothetical protein
LPLTPVHQTDHQFQPVFHYLDVKELAAGIFRDEMIAFGVYRYDGLMGPREKVRIERSGIATVQQRNPEPAL